MSAMALARTGKFVRQLTPWRARALAFVSGGMSALAFAPLGIFPFLLLAVAALVVLLDGASARTRFSLNAALLGWFWGFGQFLAGLYWVGYAFTVDVAAHGWQLPFAVAGLAGGLALFSAAAASAASFFWRDGAGRLFALASLFGAAEWLRGHVLTGFPWNIAAYGWSASLGVLQSTALIGAYGLSLLTFAYGATLAELFASTPRFRLPVIATLGFVFLWAGGDLRLALVHPSDAPHTIIRIVQPDVPQAEKYKRRFVLRNWSRLLALSVRPARQPLKVLVWPEAAPPFLLQREPVALGDIRGSRLAFPS